jgi:long-chain acyl-CoA synthetase
LVFIEDFNKTAIIFGNRQISYEEFIRSAKGYSEKMTLGKYERVIIFSENRPELLFAFFAVWEKKGICVIVDFSSSEEEFKFLIEDSKPSYIITSKTGYKKLYPLINRLEKNIDLLCFEYLDSIYIGEDVFIKTPDMDSPCLMLYTSGTTGDPKGVVLSYRNLEINLSGLRDSEIYTKEDVVLDVLPLHHIFPLVGSAIMPLHVGASVVILEELSLQSIKEAFQNNSVSLLIAVPKLYEIFFKGIMDKIQKKRFTRVAYFVLKNINSKNLSKLVFKKVHQAFGGNLKLFISGGAKISPEIVRGYQALGFDLIEGYGMTECAPMISFTPPGKIVIGSAGKVLKGCQVKIAEDKEILVKGPNVMTGYFGNPKESSEIIDEDGWLHTGDQGYLKNGYIFITGRKKEMIVLPNGKNINPLELEMEILSNTDLIEEVGVVEHNSILAAIIYPNFKKIKELEISNIIETLKLKVIDKYNSKVPTYKKILHIKIVKLELPKTKIGKLKRFKLQELLKEKDEKNENIEEPDLEEYHILKKYLNSRKGEVLPDYHLELDIGLDSLDMVELFAFIGDNFGIDMNEKILLQNPTVEELSVYINANKTKTGNSSTDWGAILNSKNDIELPKSALFLKFIKLLSGPAFKLYFRFKKEGVENIPNTPCILAGNHQSFIDGLMINNALRFRSVEKTCYLAKIKHFEKGILKYLSKNSNILTVDINKNLTESLQKIAKILQSGKNIVIFPEGLRTRDGSLNEFKKTFAILSKQLDIPVVPFAINGAYDAFSFGKKFPRPKKLSIKFFQKIEPHNLTIEEIVEKTLSDVTAWTNKK